VTGYLSDGRFIQFFRLTRNESNEFTLKETSVMDLSKEGGNYFYGLLNSTPQKLGFPDISVMVGEEVLTVNNFLGFGASSVVYQTE